MPAHILLMMKFSSFTRSLGLTSLGLALVPVAWAQDAPPPPAAITIQPIGGFHSINQAAGLLVAVVFLGGAGFALFYIIKGAIAYISAGDNPANATKGRQTIQYAVIGLVVLGLIFVIFKFVTGLVPGIGAFFS